MTMRLWLAAAALGIGLIVWGGFQPDGYLIHVAGVEGPIPYPVGGVAIFSLVAVVECLVFAALVRVVPNRSFGLLAAFLLSLVALVFWGVASMHQPPYYFMHLFWLLLVCTALMWLSLIHAVRRVAGARSREPL